MPMKFSKSLIGVLSIGITAAMLPGGPVSGDPLEKISTNPFPYCSWWVETSTTSTNIAYPDTNAAYWTTPFAVGQDSIRIDGNFINARYFSFQVYDSNGQLVQIPGANGVMSTSASTLTDFEIEPNNGSTNPFASGLYNQSSLASFTVEVTPFQAGAPVNPAAENALPMPTSGDFGFLMLRTYVPNNLPFANTTAPAANIPAAFALEAAGLPSLTLSGATSALPQCDSQQAASLTWTPPTGLAKKAAPVLIESLTGVAFEKNQKQQNSTLFQDAARGAGAQLSFLKSKPSSTPFPNGSSAYVTADFQLKAGQAAVMFANLPTTPWNVTDTGTGAVTSANAVWPVGATPVNWNSGNPSNYQLRYLSICGYVLAPPYPVTSVEDGCATDTQLHNAGANARGSEGSAGSPHVVVMTYPREEFSPNSATGAFSWIPARSSNKKSLQALAMRQMLPSTSFTNSATRIGYTADELNSASEMAETSAQTMGLYYPDGYICDVSTLRKLGPVQCAKLASQEAACKSALLERNGDRGALVNDRAVRDCLAALKSDRSNFEGFSIIKGCLIREKTQCAHHDLSNTKLKKVLLRGANIKRANLQSSDLTAAVLENAILKHAQIAGATLSNAKAQLADLSAANLASVTARKIDFTNATLQLASLKDADLRGANLRGADLQGADLRGADLRGANLQGTDLRGADTRGAQFANARTDGAIVDGSQQGALTPQSNVTVDGAVGLLAPSRGK